MEQHGKILASMHQLTGRRTQDRLLSRLAENEHVLRGVHRLLTEDVKQDQRMTPAGEWLLDNFYVIEEQIRTAAKHFPKGYSRELPQLHGGHSAGLPRVYDLALEAISHGDGRVDPEYLNRFVAAYQTVTPLKLGELWAIPIMLRLALIENLRRVAARLLVRRKDRNRADYWANLMTEVAATDPKSLILTIADMARSDPPMASSFVAELTRRLQGQGPAQSLPLSWIERRLSESGQTIDQLVRLENQQQASDQVSISNSIGSLRSLNATNWNDFVESLSAVEGILGQDPISIYGRMNFSTRDRYRHVVETIAKNAHIPSQRWRAGRWNWRGRAGRVRTKNARAMSDSIWSGTVWPSLSDWWRCAGRLFRRCALLVGVFLLWRRHRVSDGHTDRTSGGQGPC